MLLQEDAGTGFESALAHGSEIHVAAEPSRVAHLFRGWPTAAVRHVFVGGPN